MFAVPAENYQVNPIIERAMDRIFIYMPIMSKMLQHQQYDLRVPQALIPLHASQQVLLLFGGRHTVALMKPASPCSKK